MIRFNSERDLEDLIWNNETIESTVCDIPYQHRFRQLSLGDYGIADLVYIDSSRCNLWIEIVELKNTPAKIEDFMQLCRYMTGLYQFLLVHPHPRLSDFDDFHVTGTLLTQESDLSDFNWIRNFMTSVSWKTFELSPMTGMAFDNQDAVMMGVDHRDMPQRFKDAFITIMESGEAYK